MDARTLASAMGCSLSVAQKYVVDFNIALRQAGCTTVNRVAMFCAQVGHESAGLRYMEEIASGAAYEGRRDLGNIYRGDGRRFKGRGPIQLTGRHNYGKFSQWARGRGLVPTSDYFVRNPHLVATSRYGFLAAAWYWTAARPMNTYADRGDIYGASRAVNGGYNGITDRINRWNRCRRMGSALLPSGAVAKKSQPPTPQKPKTPEDEAHLKELKKGGKLKPGGATKLAYTTVAFDPNYAHCLTIAPGVGCGVHIAGINTWKNQPAKARKERHGRSVKEPGGKGSLAKNEWIHEHSSASYYVPKGVGKVDIAYATDVDGTIGVFRR